jgi:hypothetical protein
LVLFCGEATIFGRASPVVEMWECHLKPLERLVSPMSVWSLTFDVRLVRPAMYLIPCRHCCRGLFDFILVRSH